MTTPIKRLRFRVLFKRELSGTISPAANAFPSNKIAEICRSVNSLKKYAQVTLCHTCVVMIIHVRIDYKCERMKKCTYLK